ncbi:MAG: polyamine aminopropyltransferase [Halanaerobiales bacterium]|nr:polyamine aminopropyltransferase [Halanaerobiales bacterium]
MELWYTEYQTKKFGITAKIARTIHSEETDFQRLDVIDTEQFGRMLVLDGMVMTTEGDEFVYHEMISHIPMITHPSPKKIAVIGGGDGGAIRELIKHPSVEEAHLVEIDEKVIEYSKQYLPDIACGLDDPKVKVFVADGIKHIKESKNTYDVILVDSTEPIGPAVGLFSKDFYQDIYNALKEDGLFVAQTESPFFNKDLIRDTNKAISELFPIAKLYLASIPTYPSGLWSFTMGSKKYKPEDADMSRAESISSSTKYYNEKIHQSAFSLPNFVCELTVQT